MSLEQQQLIKLSKRMSKALRHQPERLGITQVSVSDHIRSLERQLDLAEKKV